MLQDKVTITCVWLCLASGMFCNSAVAAAGSSVLLEGDILTTSVNKRALLDSRVDRIWPDGIIPYQLHSDLKPIERMRVLEAMQHWNEQTTISLVPVTDAPAHLQNDYVLFKPAAGCASWVGRQGGEQAIWVGNDCSTGSLIHEIGHAVGLEHEHTRPDRDQHITIFWENISADKHHNFYVPDHRVSSIGDYDYDSVMHYGEFYFSQNGSSTIAATNGLTPKLGQRTHLSEGDVAAVASLYGGSAPFKLSQVVVNRSLEITIELENTAANNHSDLIATIPAAGRAVLQQSGGDWQCSEDTDAVSCEYDSSAGLVSSSLVITLAGEQALEGVVTVHTQSQSQDEIAPPVPAQAQSQAYSDAYQQASAGSLSWNLLIFLLPLFARRSLKRSA